MTDKEKILKYLEYKGHSKNSFYTKTGFSTGFLSQGSSLGVDKLKIVIDNYPDLNPDWFFIDGAPMIKEERKSLVQEPDQEYVSNNKQKGIPLLPFDAFAGNGDDTVGGVGMESIEERYEIPLFDGMKVDFMMTVRGSSMYPKYSSGDVVACRQIQDLIFIQWNKVYVIDSKSQGILMKRLKKGEGEDCIICKSDNKDYDSFEVPMDDVRNIALVVGVIRME